MGSAPVFNIDENNAKQRKNKYNRTQIFKTINTYLLFTHEFFSRVKIYRG